MILRDVPFSALYWLGYENFKRLFASLENTPFSSSSPSSATASPLGILMAGGLSSALAAICTHPFDVIKTQQELIQLQSGNIKETSAGVLTSSQGLESVSSLYRQGGITALYRGLLLRLMIVVPGSAVMISVYELVKRHL